MASIGDRLAERYRVDARIGSGAFATVFRAHDLRLDRDVAVKVLHANQATDPVVTARFEREARVLAAINHPNVVAIHDVESGAGIAGAEPYFVMDLCSGGSLADLLDGAPTHSLSPDILIPILTDVSAGLAALHAAGIIHRDLKPSNVLLSGGRAQIADLGIATAGPSDLTATGTAVGTLAYLAPEQLAGAAASRASDVHALGTIAFLGLTGRLPGAGDSVAALVEASALPVDPVSAVAPRLGVAFDEPVARALAPKPADRPTATELRSMLVAALQRWASKPGLPPTRLGPALGGPPPMSPSGTNDEPTTLVRTRAASRIKPRDDDRGQPRRTAIGVGAVIVILAFAALALLLANRAGSGGTPDTSVGPSPSPAPSLSASPSAAPSALPSVPPTPSPTPTVAADPYAAAQSASQAMHAAIDAARGPGGLNGKGAKDIGNQLDQFDRAISQQDPHAARDAANRLASQIADLVNHGGLDSETGTRLQSAANDLVAAANALPG